MIGTTAALIGLGIAGATANTVGGVMKSKAATSAAKTQATAADQAAGLVTDAVDKTNPLVIDAAKQAGIDVNTAATGAAGRVDEATKQANLLLNPYAEGGVLASKLLQEGLVPGGEFNRTPTMDDIMIDPGFDFRYGNAKRDFENSAGAHGGIDGGTLRKFEEFRQGVRSQEFSAAFDRFMQGRQQRYNNLMGVAEQGRSSAGTMGQNLIAGGRYGGDITYDAGRYGADRAIDATGLTTGRTISGAQSRADYLTQAANATASGKVASSNALWNGISGAANAGMDAFTLSNAFKAPAPTGNTGTPGRWTTPPFIDTDNPIYGGRR